MNKYFFFLKPFTLLLSGLLFSLQAGAQCKITIRAGDLDRKESIVSVAFPDLVKPGNYFIKDKKGRQYPLQVDSLNNGWFFVHSLAPGRSKDYFFKKENKIIETNYHTEWKKEGNTIRLQKENVPILTYYQRSNHPEESGLDQRYARAGYIHPVYSPTGIPLTNHLDTTMHPHHFGIWSAWTKTKFKNQTPDFWNLQQQTGKIEHVPSSEKLTQGPVFSSLTACNKYRTRGNQAETALDEEWKITVYHATQTATRPYHWFDIQINQTATTDTPLQLLQYHYGGMAFRGHGQWNNPTNVSIITSEGYTRKNANETRANWVCMYGTIDGKQAGIVILSHPDNYRSPQPLRIHPETPYLVFSPMQQGSFSINSDTPYVMRYRYFTFDGKPDTEWIEDLWNDYAFPPQAMVFKQ